MCSCVEHVYKMYLEYGTFILTAPVSFKRVMPLSRKTKHTFKNLIAQRGYSERVADELWKWYDTESNCLDISQQMLVQAASFYRLIPERDGLSEEEKQLTDTSDTC